MQELLKKVGYVSGLVGIVSSAVVIDAVPTELWKQAYDAAQDTELHRVLGATHYEGEELRHVYPVPYRPDLVAVLVLRGERDTETGERDREYFYVTRTGWNGFTKGER